MQTDRDSGDHGAEAQLLMHIARNHRNRQADADERDKGVEDDRDDLQGDRQGAGAAADMGTRSRAGGEGIMARAWGKESRLSITITVLR